MNAVHDLRLYKKREKLSVADKIVMHQVDNKPPTQMYLGLCHAFLLKSVR